MKVLYENKIKDATITYSSETYLYEAANVVSIDSLETWRSDDVDDYLVFEVTAGSFDCIGIKNHNFTSDVTITLEANSSDSWGSPAFSETIDYRADTIFQYFTAPVSDYAFWRIHIEDATNTDLYVEMGTVYLGNYLTLSPMTPSHKFTYNTNSTNFFSTSNQVFGDSRLNYKEYSITYPNVLNADRLLLETWFNYSKNVTPFFMAIWEDSLTIEKPQFAVFSGDGLSYTYSVNNLFGMTINYREVQ
jgi:hypothetical protein